MSNRTTEKQGGFFTTVIKTENVAQNLFSTSLRYRIRTLSLPFKNIILLSSDFRFYSLLFGLLVMCLSVFFYKNWMVFKKRVPYFNLSKEKYYEQRQTWILALFSFHSNNYADISLKGNLHLPVCCSYHKENSTGSYN
jgi:hypothetical protein